ncbi:MAG: NAD(P)/FAD-dependent oxidoreductase [Ectothiorhodospiraceae bacterium]|jgi:flavin-dependent dehydrogenase
MTQATECDVVVIGGGPGGSTVSTLLAESGWSVVMLEKAHHPRFHIGESLLPMSLPVFRRLGVADAVARRGIAKYGAEFVSMEHGRSCRYAFGRALDKGYPHAYEIKRADFDEILFRNATEKGVDAREGIRVEAVDFSDPDRIAVSAVDTEGRPLHWRTRQVVDASGRDTFLARQLGRKRKDPRHNSAAVFTHFRGARLHEGDRRGDISLFWFDHGWFWFIPFEDGTVSVGAVCWPDYLKTRRGDLDSFLRATIELCPPLAERLQQAKATMPAQATGNYSYRCDNLYGDRYVLVGDAYAFVDPVFSSGVHLALNGGVMASDLVDARLRGHRRAKTLARRYRRLNRRSLKAFSWFIYRITQPALRNLLMSPRNALRLEEAMLSLLAGDLYRDTPVHWRLQVFKLLYYANFLLTPVRNWRNYRRRLGAAKSPA